MRLTDIHCHILPGIDDGAANGKMTVSMLRKAYAEGVRRIIVTPHYRRGMFEPPMDKVYKRYLQVRKKASEIGAFGIEVYLGCEYHRHSDMAEVLESGRRPTMAGSRYVLTEFSSVDPYSRVRGTLYELVTAGYIPIIAHAERYQAFFENMENVADAIALGAMIQINADSLVGESGFKTKQFCKKLMKEDMVQFIASDAHNIKDRPSRLGQCAKYVERKWGRDRALRIFEENPSRIIGR